MPAKRSIDRALVAAIALAACGPPAGARDPAPLIEAPAAAPVRTTAVGPAAGSDDDGDGLAAWADLCPNQPEDPDDFDDDDGCPDPDNDDDGRADADDLCPDEPETADGVDDADGCPEAAVVQLATPEVVAVDFRAGNAEVEAQARSLLDALAQTLLAHPEVQLVELAGHKDAGERRAGLDLARAQSVERYLVARGVTPDRLVVRGYGADVPRARGGLNRRVEVQVRIAVQP